MKKRDLRPAARKISPGPGKLATPDSAKWRRMRHGKPPSNLTLPTISGTVAEYETLTATTGTWAGDPESYTYQWYATGVAIPGATTSTYVLTAAEISEPITVVVTATNMNGSTSTSSAATSAVEDYLPPANTILPAITGTATETWTLAASTGTWTNADSYAYQWKRDGVNIGGATASSYELTDADVGTVITVTVTATNIEASVAATSAGTAAIAAVPDPVIEQNGGNQTSTGVLTDTFTFGSTTVTGRGLVVTFALYNGGRVSAVTDSKGNIYTLIDYRVNGLATVEMWYCPSIVGGAAHALTVTYAASTNAVWGAVELSGVKADSGFLDIGSVATASGTGSPSAVTSGTLRQKKEIVVSMIAVAGGGANAAISTPAGFTEFLLFNNYSATMAGEGATKAAGNSTSPVTTTWTHAGGGAAPYAAITAAFRATAAAQIIASRASQVNVETVHKRTADARVGQVNVETVHKRTADARVGQVNVEVIRSTA